METVIIVTFCLAIIALSIAATFFYAENRSDKRFIQKQEEMNMALKSENKELYARLLLKNGVAPIGVSREPQPTKPDRDKVKAPVIVTARQAAEREDPNRDYLDAAKKIYNS